MTVKICTDCGQPKPLTDFHAEKRGALGRRADCKTCRTAKVAFAQREQRIAAATSARRTLDLATTEEQWLQTVIDLATTLKWVWYHTRDSRRSPAGFPDLVLVRDRIIFAELKKEGGRVSAQQDDWLFELKNAGAEVYVWRPHDYPEVQRTLTRRGAP